MSFCKTCGGFGYTMNGKAPMTHEKNEPINYDPSPRLPTPLHPLRSFEILEAERDAALDALEEALNGWEYAAQYKGEFLMKKHGDAEDIARLRGLLGARRTIQYNEIVRKRLAAEWEALCVRAAGWVGRGPEKRRRETADEAQELDRTMDVRLPISDRITTGSIYGLALFARLMAIVSRPS